MCIRDSRLLGPGIVGGLVGAGLSSMPVIGAFNLCFCMLNIIGCQVGLAAYFQQNPHDKLSGGDAAVLGVISGATAGLLSSILLLLAWSPLLAVGGTEMRAIFVGSGAITTMMVVGVYAGFGALGGFLGLVVFFSSRRKVT